MSPSGEDQGPHALDHLSVLPAENRRSLLLVMIVQAMNSFSDNFSKMLFIVFGHAVAAGTALGDQLQTWLGLIFSLPYIFFAPLAGYLSDRYSKKKVVFWMQVAQVLVFVAFLGALSLRQTQPSLILGFVCFFVLATEAAMFAPAKMGILKDLAGSRRLGLVSGVQQMTMFAAILAGYALAGAWFGGQIKKGLDPWNLALGAIGLMTLLAVIQTVLASRVKQTEEHPEIHWRTSLWWEHFDNLGTVFRVRAVGIAALGIVFFWFMSNAVGTILVGLCNEQYPAEEDSARMKGLISAALGVGVVGGSLLASVLCRKQIKLGLVPLAGFVLALGLAAAWHVPPRSWLIFPAMGFSGLAAGVFMVPLYGFVQDRSRENERAQVLSGIGLLDCVGGAAANLMVFSLLRMKVPSALQLGLMGGASLVTAVLLLGLPRLKNGRNGSPRG